MRASEPTLSAANAELARNLPRTLLIRQAFVGLSALLVIAIFAHKLIVLDWEITVGVIEAGAYAAAVASVVTLLVSYIHLRRHRRVLMTIASDAQDIEPDAIARLAAVPNALTWRFLTLSSLASFVIVIPGVRPVLLDDGRATGLVILTITILAASALPHYVLARHATVKVLEMCPLEPLGTVLDALELEQIPERRVTQRLLFAVVPPVALLGVGAVLVAHAHLRTLTEQSGRATAQMIARAALEPSPAHPAARAAALAAAAQLGFESRIDDEKLPEGEGQFRRRPDGQLVVLEPVTDGHAVIKFAPDLSTGDMTTGGVIAFFAVVLAAVFASLFGYALADDLVMATRSVRMLGTETVFRGATRIARPARFAVVAALGRAIEELTDRFRVFAKAQERALESRLAAQRMRGLLFASVSHDLKSPLNAILGFAELLATEDLTAAQKESLGLIAARGRELLGLIETILDAARVEARLLSLIPKATEVSALVAEATRKGRELANQPDALVVAEVAGDLKPLMLDATYGARAIAVIIAHALRSVAPTGRSVRVRAYESPTPGVRLDIEYGRGDVTPEELEGLLARQASSRARGITLGLSLARAVIELHGGRIEVQRAPDGTAICQIFLPLEGPPSKPPPRIPSSLPPRRPV